MNSPTLIFVFGVAILLVTPRYACAQWENFGGPNKSQIHDIESRGPYLFASTDEGIFRSKDDGNSWVTVNSGLPMDIFFTDLALIDTDLFAVTKIRDEARVVRSTDNGENWIEASAGLPDELHSLAVIGEQLFVIGTDSSSYETDIYSSTNFGESWQPIGGETLDADDSDFLAVKGSNLFAVTHDRVYRSANYGESWTLVTTDLNADESWIEVKKGVPVDVEVLSLVATGDNLFASAWVSEEINEKPLGRASYHCVRCVKFEALFRSTDNGHTWTLLNWEKASKDTAHTAFYYVVARGDTLLACTWKGVFRSTNNGENWTAVNSGLPAEEGEQILPLVTTLAVIGGKLFAGTWDGVYVSANNGKSWTAANSGLPENTIVQSFAVDGRNLYASFGAHGVYLSQDDAKTWTSAGSGSKVIGVGKITPIGTDLFTTNMQGLYRSTNSGDSWTAVKPVPGFNQRDWGLSISASGTEIFVATNDNIYHSTDYGKNWNALNGTPPWGIVTLLASGTDVFVGAWEQGLFRSTNNGESWTPVDSGLPEYSRGAYLTKIGENLFASDSSGIFRSTNNGESWIAINSGLPAPPFRDASPWRTEVYNDAPVLKAVGSHLFVSTEEGVFLFNNDEATWTPVNVGLPANTLVSIDASSADLFAHTRDAGTWRLRMSQLPGATE